VSDLNHIHANPSKLRTPASSLDHNSPGSSKFWIPGFPATFATAREAPWREALEKALPNAPDGVIPIGVLLSFSVEATTRGGQGFDLDNLCEPVFSVLVNRKGFFGGKRPNIRWWHASRRVASPGGCRIEPSNHNSPPQLEGDVVFAGKYQGELPRSASETAIAHWIETTGSQCQILPEDTIAVSLDFGTPSINIGDFATGRVKSVIDNLYPILGGVAGAPDDWRISELCVAKGQERLGKDELEICLYRVLKP